MINECLEELASLHVLGVLTPEEKQEMDAALRRDPEVRALVTRLLAARDGLAGTVPAASPSPQLKQRIMAQLPARENKAVPLPVRKSAGGFLGFWLPWALTAASVFLCVNLTMQKGALREQLGVQTARADELSRMADSLRAETNSLQQAVATLKETTRLEDIRIAILGSMLTESPKAEAVSLWDDRQQSGVFVVQNLKPLPADRDYQLWVIDPKYATPVSAGVFQVDGQGGGRISFKPNKIIATAGKFAVTLEPKGGLPTPTLKNLVLLGG
jgi:anti-sigma-K factor RskA